MKSPKNLEMMKMEHLENMLIVKKYGMLMRTFLAMIETIKSTALCPICHAFVIGCSILSCGHCFCTHCIKLYLIHKKVCPICGELAEGEVICERAFPIDSVIDDFHQILENYDEWYAWISDLEHPEYLSNLGIMTPEFMDLQVQKFKDNPVPVLLTQEERAVILENRRKYFEIQEAGRNYRFMQYLAQVKAYLKKMSFNIFCVTFYLFVAIYGDQYMEPDLVNTLRAYSGIFILTGLCRYSAVTIEPTHPYVDFLNWFIEDRNVVLAEQLGEAEEEEEDDQDFPAWNEIRAIIYNETAAN